MNSRGTAGQAPHVPAGTAAPDGRRRPEPLRVRRDFLAIQRSGMRAVTPGFVVQVGRRSDGEGNAGKRPGKGGMAPRIGYTVSRKVGGAVERNRVRRRLRELARQVLWPRANEGCDYVLIGRRAALQRPFARMAQDLARALDKLNGKRAHSGHRQGDGDKKGR